MGRQPSLPAFRYSDFEWDVEPISRGSFGIVRRGTKDGTSYAVKVQAIDCADPAAVENERGVLSRVFHKPHPNVVQVFGTISDAPDGHLRLVLKLCDGGTVAELIQRAGALTLDQVLSILVQVLAGLGHLHSLGVVHRDVRADNVLVTSLEPLAVVLADFSTSYTLSAFRGASWLKLPTIARRNAVVSGSVVTGPLGRLVAVEWVAPEVCLAIKGGDVEIPASASTDIYMVGSLMFELLTGEPPYYWLVGNQQLLLDRRASDTSVPIPGVRGSRNR